MYSSIDSVTVVLASCVSLPWCSGIYGFQELVVPTVENGVLTQPLKPKGRQMSEEEMQALQGQVQAMGLVMTAIVSVMDQLPAATAALNLAIALEEMKQEDTENLVPPAEIRSRVAIGDAYLGMLSAVAKQQ